ncbi:hypothetical protein BH11VER1_BH11VER1_22150 [soil metagenome]
MNTDAIKRIALIILAFWGVAILAPIIVGVIPTSSGATPKIFEFFVPLFQIMLAFGTTLMIWTALATKKDS